MNNLVSKTRLIPFVLAALLALAVSWPVFSQGVNSPPDTSPIPGILIKDEGDIINPAEIEQATDPDGDSLTYAYSGWQSSLPYTVTGADKGIHNIHVVVSDGTDSSAKNIAVVVGGRLITELYVKEGTVSFVNLLSDILFYVSQGDTSRADDEGRITEPKEASDEEKQAWESGFELPGGPGGSGSSSTQKGEASTVETSSDETGGDEPPDIPEPPDENDPDERKDDQNYKQGKSKDEGAGDEDEEDDDLPPNDNDNNGGSEDGDTEVNAGINVNPDADGDGVHDEEDDLPHNPLWSKWTGSKDEAQEGNSIILDNPEQEDGSDSVDDESVLILNNLNSTPKSGKEDYELAEELKDIYNDIGDMETAIDLATLDNTWETIRDAQSGKVVRDIHGNRVRLANYVLRPADDKVAIAFLSHRRDGAHAGVSSLTFSVTFNKPIEDGVLLKDLPWSRFMESGRVINYGYSELGPEYYPKPNPVENIDPANAAMVLTAQNPAGDRVEFYEGFGGLVDGDGIWHQPQIALLNNLHIYTPAQDGIAAQDVWRNLNTVIPTTGPINGDGTFSAEYNFGEPDYFKLSAYVIDDYNGDIQPYDFYTDGSFEPLEINGIRDLLDPGRAYNLEFILNSTELDNVGRSIDVIISPEVMRPYASDDEDGGEY